MLGRPADRAHDRRVSGATADLPGDRDPDLLVGGIRISVQECPRREDHARRAEPALQPVHLMEPLLDGVQAAVVLEAFDRGDLVALGGRGQHRARLRRLAVHQHDARPAVGGVAAPMRAGQAELVAQEVDEQQPRLDVAGGLLAGDGDRYAHDAAYFERQPSQQKYTRLPPASKNGVASPTTTSMPHTGSMALMTCGCAVLEAMICARIETAISPGVGAPLSAPAGVWMRSRSASGTSSESRTARPRRGEATSAT